MTSSTPPAVALLASSIAHPVMPKVVAPDTSTDFCPAGLATGPMLSRTHEGAFALRVRFWLIPGAQAGGGGVRSTFLVPQEMEIKTPTASRVERLDINMAEYVGRTTIIN